MAVRPGSEHITPKHATCARVAMCPARDVVECLEQVTPEPRCPLLLGGGGCRECCVMQGERACLEGPHLCRLDGQDLQFRSSHAISHSSACPDTVQRVPSAAE